MSEELGQVHHDIGVTHHRETSRPRQGTGRGEQDPSRLEGEVDVEEEHNHVSPSGPVELPLALEE